MSDAVPVVDFDTTPEHYRHWTLATDGDVATLTLAVDEDGGLVPGYELKANSYDLGVDIELYDAIQRVRFEHPAVKAIVITGGLEKMFCAGANIRMLAQSSHAWKVNFCKFTNETRNGLEDASEHSGIRSVAAVNGTAAGGGYEIALACDEIVLIDDGSSTVSLPEVPLLGVLPGTGGLTRVVDKRHVRKDRADLFATKAEGFRGQTAVDWGLVDSTAPRNRFAEHVAERARVLAEGSSRPGGPGRRAHPAGPHRGRRRDRLLPRHAPPSTGPPAGSTSRCAAPRPTRRPTRTAYARWASTGGRWPSPASSTTWCSGCAPTRPGSAPGSSVPPATPTACWPTTPSSPTCDDWFVAEVRHYWKRTLKRLDVTSRSLIAVIEPGSCFAGMLAELALACDRQYMLDGVYEDVDPDAEPATIVLTAANDGSFPMGNGLSRLESRFWGRDDELAAARKAIGDRLDARAADDLGLVTWALDDLDLEDDLRIALEERASLSPDALTGMEANHRFVGPETVESKIFGRLTAWQNWIFYRPNASGPDGALRRYGSGQRGSYDYQRV